MTVRKLRVAIADDNSKALRRLWKTLKVLGHFVVISVNDGKSLVKYCRKTKPDLIITDLNMPRMNGLEAVEAICREMPVPVILVSESLELDAHDPVLLKYVDALIPKSFTLALLEPTIGLAMERFRVESTLRSEADELRDELVGLEVVESALGYLAKLTNISRNDAYGRLVALADEKNIDLVRAAEEILDTASLIDDPPGPALPATTK